MSEGGVYKIQNTVNGKRYIGSAVSLKKRWRAHRWWLRRGEHHSRSLQRAWDKYGEAAFEFIPMLICDPVDLILHEQLALDGLKPEYNIAKKAGSTLGVRYSDEAKARISKIHKGKKLSAEHIAVIIKTNTGKKCAPETRAKIGRGNKGKKRSAAACAALSKRMRGRVDSEATQRKKSMSHTGMKHSAETKAKIGNSNRGKTTGVKRGPQSPEHIAKRLLSRKISMGY